MNTFSNNLFTFAGKFKNKNMADLKVVKSSDINIKIGLNKDQMPVKIDWQSSDGPNGGDSQECKAILLALFDKENRETLKIDLWTTEMQVMEMDRFMYQNLRALADTYFKATKNQKLASAMQQFVQYFGEETKIIPKS